MRTPLIIDGQARAGTDHFETLDPATNTTLAEVARATSVDVDDAVAAARQAFATWRNVRPIERGRLLAGISRAIVEQGDELARLECLDTGKPLRQARADIEVSARYFEFYGGMADKILGTTIPLGDDFLDYTVREPLGVSAQIIPWNYPMQIGCRGIAAALAAGNTVVAKPAAEAPLTLVRLAQIALAIGLPPGVLNVLSGHGTEAGAPLAAHPDVNQITFTGSVEVGSQVMAAAARGIVPIVLELGGKSPNVVFSDADLDAALPVILASVLQNAGQTCSAGARLIVHHSIADEVLSRLCAMMEAVGIGPGVDDPDLGPLISARQLARVEAIVAEAARVGCEVITGGMTAPESKQFGGFFYTPTIVLCDRTAAIMRDEVFGPVIAAIVFDSDEEAFELANGTEYGLVTGVWTRDVTRAHVAAREISAGQIYVNGYGAGGGVELPFGGYRKSGFGREKGIEGLNSYLQTKNVCVRLT